MTVKQVVSREEAIQLSNDDTLYDAEEWIVDPEHAGTPLHLHRRLAPSLTKQLRFASMDGPKEPSFVSGTDLDNQAMRGVRQLRACEGIRPTSIWEPGPLEPCHAF